MTATLVKGWCPSLGTPMESGDGWIVRVKPPGSRLSADDVRALAGAATGNGLVDLTGRSNIQFRGFRHDAIADFAALVVARGLGVAAVAVEQIRSVMVAPLAGERALAVARAIEAGLGADPVFRTLPPKFGFAVAGDGGLPIAMDTADITVDLDTNTIVIPAQAGIHSGAARDVAMDPGLRRDDGGELALRLARAFLRLVPPARRMRYVDGERVFADAGLKPAPIAAVSWTPTIGPLPDHGAVVVGLPFGQITVRDLARLAELAGDGILHLCPWRAIAIRGDITTLIEGAQRLGLVTDPTDPRLRIVACTGKPGCPNGTVPTRADAAWAAHMDLVPSGATLHLSGCPKGCAHPTPATAVLTGRDGHYDLILGGRADGSPLATGLSMEEAGDLLTSLLEGRA